MRVARPATKLERLAERVDAPPSRADGHWRRSIAETCASSPDRTSFSRQGSHTHGGRTVFPIAVPAHCRRLTLHATVRCPPRVLAAWSRPWSLPALLLRLCPKRMQTPSTAGGVLLTLLSARTASALTCLPNVFVDVTMDHFSSLHTNRG
jgi:hypothetical protein